MNTSNHPSEQVITTGTHTDSPSGEGTPDADSVQTSGAQRDKRDSARLADPVESSGAGSVAPGLVTVALRTAAQRLRDDAADPLLPDLVALVLGAGTMGGQQPEVQLARQASPQALATVWNEVARYLEGLAEQWNPTAGQSGQQPLPSTSHNTDEERRAGGGVASGHDPSPAGTEVAP